MLKRIAACGAAALMVMAFGGAAHAGAAPLADPPRVGAVTQALDDERVGFGVGIPAGACCVPGGCVFVTEPECSGMGGTFRGAGVPCAVPAQYRVQVQPGGPLDLSGAPVVNLLPSVLPNRDDGATQVPIGFAFPLFGQFSNTAFVCTNGFVTFGASSTVFENAPTLPTVAAPNRAIYGYWDDLDLRTVGQLRMATLGPPLENPRLVIEWQNVPRFQQTDSNTFQIVLYPDGVIELRYGAVTPAPLSQATTGIENASGTVGVQVPRELVGDGNRVVRLVPVPEHPACPPEPACGTGGIPFFDQIDPAGQTGQSLSQSTNCPGCLLADASYACMDDFEINGTQGVGGSGLLTALQRVEAVIRNSNLGPSNPQWRVNVFSSFGAGADSPVGNVYAETFAAPSCTIPFFDDARYPGFSLVSFDLGTGLFSSGSRSLAPGLYYLSVVAVTPGPAPDIFVALSGNNAGNSVEPDAARVRYFPPPSEVLTFNQNAAYRLFMADAPGCPADFNGDGNLDPDDLSDYIGCYFTPPCAGEDFNGDGNRDPDDLSDYIGAYFSGGC